MGLQQITLKLGIMAIETAKIIMSTINNILFKTIADHIIVINLLFVTLII